MHVFDHIHKLIRQGRGQDALRELVDCQSGNLRQPYCRDMNHAWYTVGEIHYSCGEFHEALKAFQSARKGDKDDYQAVWAIADCYSQIGNHEFAERYYRLAYSFGFDVDQISYNIACELYDQNKIEESLAYLQNIITDDPVLAEKIEKNRQKALTKLGVRGTQY